MKRYILRIYRWNGTADHFRLEQESDWFVNDYYPTTQIDFGKGLQVDYIPTDTLAEALTIIRQAGLDRKEVR